MPPHKTLSQPDYKNVFYIKTQLNIYDYNEDEKTHIKQYEMILR